MNKPIVIYDEARGKILAKYVESFGKFCEVDVTDQTLQAVFRYLMAYGLSLAEHCEYEVDGNKFRTSLVKQEAPTIEPVKRGKWINTYGETPYDPRDKNNWWHCSECEYPVTTMFKSPWCPQCGAKMDGDGK